jgi:SpoVK/Ycf46/Vps4 family AAA+-type ATPase
VFVVATANQILSLPPELLRKGRFDEIFFVDLPTRSERIEIFRVHLGKRLLDPRVSGGFALSEDVLGALADLSEGFIGSEIEQVVIGALYDAFYEDRSITMDDLARAIHHTVPLSVTQAEQIHALREWANVRAVAATAAEDRQTYQTALAGAAPAEKPAPPPEINAARGGRTLDF